MKRIITFLILFFLGISAKAQNITVKSFQALPMDMTASSLEGKRIDQNGVAAALIKIVTSQTGFAFDGGTLGIVDSKQMVGEIWVWVPYGSRKITISHQQLGVLREYRYPVEIQSERTYEMVLVTGTVETIVKEEVRMQYLTFQVTPPNATLEVNDQLWSLDSDGIATKYVEFGTYTYRVRATDYFPDAGRVVVEDPNNTKVVPVTLKSNRAEVTLKVDADAEIWVNNERKGIRTWTGSLGSGTFKIECKQANHEPSVVSKEITAEMNGQIITLPAPTPIYGSLNVESAPQMAALYIDGKEMGKTPRSINEILVGQHEIKLVKEGYADYAETITIAKGERKQVTATLSNGKEILFTCNVNSAQLEIDGQRVGSASGTYMLTYGQHTLKATADNYADYSATLNVTESSRNHNVTLKSSGMATISQFFPLYGVTLGQTTWKEAEKLGCVVKTSNIGYGKVAIINKITFWDHDEVGIFTSLFWTKYDGAFPDSWKQLGFSWDNSYNDWLKTFRRLGYTITIEEEPKTEILYSGRKTLSAEFVAESPDGTLKFRLNFREGNNNKDGYGKTSPRSLHGIHINVSQSSSGQSTQTQTIQEAALPDSQLEGLRTDGLKEQDKEQPVTTTRNISSEDLTFTVDDVSFTMKLVEGGTFQMGATSEQGSEADSDEKPIHSVTLGSYYMGETEVTQALWKAVMGMEPSYDGGWVNDYGRGNDYPAYRVSWNDIQKFVTKLNLFTGKQFRLPTEAEWEYAARGGKRSNGYKYAGSSNIGSVAWYTDNSGSKTHPVKGKNPNELGLYDMSGNVWEWCQDWYDSYSNSTQTNPRGPSNGSYRVVRGGSWNSRARGCRVSDRPRSDPDSGYGSGGFRLVLPQ